MDVGDAELRLEVFDTGFRRTRRPSTEPSRSPSASKSESPNVRFGLRLEWLFRSTPNLDLNRASRPDRPLVS